MPMRQKYNHKSQELDHFQLIILQIPLLEPFHQNAPPLFLLLPRLLVIKRIACQPQIPHHSVVDVKGVEQCEYDHQDGEDNAVLLGDGDLAEEVEEGGIRG